MHHFGSLALAMMGHSKILRTIKPIKHEKSAQDQFKVQSSAWAYLSRQPFCQLQ